MHILCPHCHNPIEVVKLTPREEIACPSCGSSFRLETDSTTGWEGLVGKKLGKFELLDRVGHGAFGTVYKARDPELDRTVAIKVPRAGNLAGPQELDRFLREARSVAQLRHPSIVSVHEVGQSDGVPYLVSDFVSGITLADLLSGRRPGFREAAELIAAVAEALHFAHERGVVHRDVKPSNIMIGDGGTPCVMDFGLAKRDAGEITMTIEGQVLGTPAYMSPEQARGDAHKVDGRSDVYSLGVILYELLTGELPFRGTKRMLLHQVLHDDPKPPRNLNDKIPRDLETVCLKAMAKEPPRRYGTAKELAEDLRRWLNGEAIQARPVGRVERATRWARRHPAAAALVAVSGVAALALVGLGVGLVYNGQLQTAYTAEEEQRKKAETALGVAEEARKGEEEQRKDADQLRYLQGIFLADVALRENNDVVAKERLQECKDELRGWEWHYLNGRCHPEVLILPGSWAAFSPDGTRIAVRAGPSGVVRVFDMGTGHEVLTLQGPPSRHSTHVEFSPDGKSIATANFPPSATADGEIFLYDALTGQQTLVLKGTAQRHDKLFSPDGTRIAARNTDGVVRVYDARTGQEVLVLKGPKKLFIPVFSPDGTRIAVAPRDFGDGIVRVFDARTGQEVMALQGPANLGVPMFSPDGLRILVGSESVLSGDGVIRVFDARTGQETFSLKGPAKFGLPRFSPDGTRIAAADRNGVGRVYDARTGRELFTLGGQTPLRIGVFSPVFSPDGESIATTDGDGCVRVVNGRTGPVVLSFKGPAKFGNPVFSPDGARIAIEPHHLEGDGIVRVFDVRTSTEALAIKQPFSRFSQVNFSPDGALIAVVGPQSAGDPPHIGPAAPDGVVRVFDALAGHQTFAPKEPTLVTIARFSSNGERILVRGKDWVWRGYDLRTGQETFVPKRSELLGFRMISPDLEPLFDKRPQDGGALGISPDGARIAVGPGPTNGEGEVRIFDALTGLELFSLNGTMKRRSRIVFSPNGELIARITLSGPDIPSGPPLVALHDARSGQETFVLKGQARGGVQPISPDGKRIVLLNSANSMMGSGHVFDTQTGQETVSLKGSANLDDPRFSPDGTRIVAGCFDGALRFFDTRTGQVTLALMKPHANFSGWTISPDGTRVALACDDGVLRIYDAPKDIPAWQARRRQALAAGLPGWHRQQALEHEQAGQWFAAAFHLDRLLRHSPDDQDLNRRLEAARKNVAGGDRPPLAPVRMEPLP